MNKGFFGGLFDLNGDGKLDSFEQFLDYSAFMETVGKEDGDDEDENDEEDVEDEE